MARFDLDGDALCLDFVNTIADRQRLSTERLGIYANLLAWARQSGVVTPGEARRLARQSRRSPRQAAAVLAKARSLRERLYAVFAALSSGRAPAASDVSSLNVDLTRARADLRLSWRGRRFIWEWSGLDRLDGMLSPVLRSAADLLASAEAAHVRGCDGPTCTWLFVDRSRTRRRRWCSMKTCGNRNKARLHYQRVRGLLPKRSGPFRRGPRLRRVRGSGLLAPEAFVSIQTSAKRISTARSVRP